MATDGLQVGDQYIATSITVLEQKTGPQCIFGLDNLRRHHCVIDLAMNELRIGSCGVALAFLPEHQVPKDFNMNRQTQDLDDTAGGGSQQVAEGDMSVLWPSGSQQAAEGSQRPPAAAAASQPAGGAAAGAATGGASEAGGGGASDELARRLQEITGEDLDKCRRALAQAGGNLDAAASNLMGW
jgi:DNA damage-inducible protein 1